MAKLINSAILAEIKSLYPYMKITPFTSQQERLLTLILEGATEAAAARAAGYATTVTARTFLGTDKAQAVLKYFAESEMEKITITRDRLTAMALECYQERGNAMEGLKAVDVLARLHGKNEETKQKATKVTINQQNNINHGSGNTDIKAVKKKMQSMSDEQLLEFVGQNTTLEPTPLEEKEGTYVPAEIVGPESVGPNDDG